MTWGVGNGSESHAIRRTLAPAASWGTVGALARPLEHLAGGVTTPYQGGLIAADEGGLVGPDDGSPSPFEEFQAQWAAAHSKAQETFSKRPGAAPSEGTLQAAAWLGMEIARGWDASRGINEGCARKLLKELFAERLVGRIGPGGRPLLWAAASADPQGEAP